MEKCARRMMEKIIWICHWFLGVRALSSGNYLLKWGMILDFAVGKGAFSKIFHKWLFTGLARAGNSILNITQSGGLIQNFGITSPNLTWILQNSHKNVRFLWSDFFAMNFLSVPYNLHLKPTMDPWKVGTNNTIDQSVANTW